METLISLLLTALDLADRVFSKPLSSRQTAAIEQAAHRIQGEMKNIEAQATERLPKFSGPAHEKAVILTSWELLYRDLEPLRHIPHLRRRTYTLLGLIKRRDAPGLMPKMQSALELFQGMLLRRGQ
jgi:hypothetical protein